MEELDKGRDWLQGEVARANRDEVRQLARAAGLQVFRSGGRGGAWLQVDALREALVKHLEPTGTVGFKRLVSDRLTQGC